MSEQNINIVRRFVDEVWNRRNPSLADQLLTPDCAIHTPDGAFRGPAGYRQLHSVYAKAFPGCEVSIEDMVAEGDKVVCRFTFRGKHQGDFKSIASTGKAVTVQGMTIVRLVDGKIDEEYSVWDTLSLMNQLGAVTAPAKTKGAGR